MEIKDIPTNLIPGELWKAFALILLSLLVLVVKKYLTEMKDSNKEFRDQLLKLTVNDAVQDERLDTLEGTGKIVNYKRGSKTGKP